MPQVHKITDKVSVEIPDNYKKRPARKLNEWLAELRRDDIIQGTGQLCTLNKDNSTIRNECCLGVYCRVREVPFTIRTAEEEKRPFGSRRYDSGAVAYLPKHIAKEFNPNRSYADLILAGYDIENSPVFIIKQYNGEEAEKDREHRIPSSDPINVGWIYISAVDLNDQHQLNFKQIAQVLELIFEHDDSPVPQDNSQDSGQLQETPIEKVESVADGVEKA